MKIPIRTARDTDGFELVIKVKDLLKFFSFKNNCGNSSITIGYNVKKFLIPQMEKANTDGTER